MQIQYRVVPHSNEQCWEEWLEHNLQNPSKPSLRAPGQSLESWHQGKKKEEKSSKWGFLTDSNAQSSTLLEIYAAAEALLEQVSMKY